MVASDSPLKSTVSRKTIKQRKSFRWTQYFRIEPDETKANRVRDPTDVSYDTRLAVSAPPIAWLIVRSITLLPLALTAHLCPPASLPADAPPQHPQAADASPSSGHAYPESDRPGTRTVEPSSACCAPVKIIQPAVGCPTTLPNFSDRYPSVKSSASDSEDSFVTSTVGRPSALWPRFCRYGTGGDRAASSSGSSFS